MSLSKPASTSAPARDTLMHTPSVHLSHIHVAHLAIFWIAEKLKNFARFQHWNNKWKYALLTPPNETVPLSIV